MEASKDDVKNIIEGIKRLMPDFSVTKEDLVNIKSTFVITFYRRYLNELARNWSTLFSNDGDFVDVLEMCPRTIEPEMFLFRQTRDSLNRIGVSYFTICDFYRPSNRTRLTIKVCLNFLLYIKENLPTGQGIVKSVRDKVKNTQLQKERILDKKRVIAELSREIGLSKEKLCELQREYDAETNLQVTPLDTQVKLDNEIQEIEKNLEAMKTHVASQEQRKSILDAKVKDLKDQVISDDFESKKEILEQLEVKVEEHKRTILQSEEALEEKHKELTYITEHTALLQNCDISALDYIEELDSLKQKVNELESARDKIQSCIEEKQSHYGIMKQDLADTNKKHQEWLTNLETTLSELNHAYDKSLALLHDEKEFHKNLEKNASNLKVQLEDREKACAELEEKHVFMQTELQRIYQQMLSSQNLITTSFNDVLQFETKGNESVV